MKKRNIEEINKIISGCLKEKSVRHEMLDGCLNRISLTDSEVELKEMYIFSTLYLQQLYNAKLRLLKMEAYKKEHKDCLEWNKERLFEEEEEKEEMEDNYIILQEI